MSEDVRAALLASDAGGQGCRDSFAALLEEHVPGAAPWTPASIAITIASFVTPNEEVSAMVRRLGTTYRLGVVTNGGSKSQREKLHRAQLFELFSVTCISGESGFAKPAPQMFQTALAGLDCSPSDAMFVGDSLRCDILGAAALGIRTCWVDADLRTHPAADLVIGHVLALEASLAE